MEEIWKDIPGYEGLYQVSNLGRVRRVDSGRILKPQKCTAGYLKISLSKKSIEKQFLVHRIVAKVFIQNQFYKPQVNHIDGDKTNNCVNNLEWCNNQENNIHSFRELGRKSNGWKKFARKVMCVETNKKYESVTIAANTVGVTHESIRRAASNPKYTCKGYHWEFL